MIICLIFVAFMYIIFRFYIFVEYVVRTNGPHNDIINIYKLFSHSIPLMLQNFHQKFGKIYDIYIISETIKVITDPDVIKKICVEDFQHFVNRRKPNTKHDIINKNLFLSRDNDWKRIRSIVSPIFTGAKIKRMFPIVVNCADELIHDIQCSTKFGHTIDLSQMLLKYTMNVITSCSFSTKINAHSQQDHPLVVNAKNITNFRVSRVLSALILPPVVLKMLNIESFFNVENVDYFYKFIDELIIHRIIDSKGYYCDFFQTLMNTTTNDTDKNNKFLTVDEMVAQAITFFAAGAESTSASMIFSLYELAINNGHQERLYEELIQAFPTYNDLNCDKLSKLPFLDSVIAESIRMYTPFTVLEREVINDRQYITKDNITVNLKKGQNIIIPIHVIHQSNEYYIQPKKFIPDRFMPSNRSLKRPYTYLPFGAGPRSCIGMRFALIVAKVCIASIIRQYQVFRVKQTDVPLKYKTFTILMDTKRVIIGIKSRE